MSTYHDLTNLDHDKDLAVALGTMVVAWANAETAVVAVMARVTGIKHQHGAYELLPNTDFSHTYRIHQIFDG